MSFTLSSGISGRGSYSRIPEETPTKTALTLDTVLKEWNPTDEIKYTPSFDAQGVLSGHYYSTSQKPASLVDRSFRFLARFLKPEERAVHQTAFEAIVTELKNTENSSCFAVKLESDFVLSKLLGQPLTVDDLRQIVTPLKENPTSSLQKKGIRSFSFSGKSSQNLPEPAAKKGISFSTTSYQNYRSLSDKKEDL